MAIVVTDRAIMAAIDNLSKAMQKGFSLMATQADINALVAAVSANTTVVASAVTAFTGLVTANATLTQELAEEMILGRLDDYN